MSTLHEVVHRGKVLRKSLGKRMKRLRKEVKRTAKKGEEIDGALSEELESFRRQFREVLDLEATRAEADATTRVDVIVDGQVILAQVTVAVLLSLREEVRYQQKLYRRLSESSPTPTITGRAARIEALRSAVEIALTEANQRPAEEVSISGPVDAYLFG